MEFSIPLWFEIGTYVALALILGFDIVLAFRRPHIPSTRESALWISFYVVLALVFAALMYVFAGAEHSGQFIAGWLTEYSLSIDNLFVFLIIMARFSVPRKYQQELLMAGIIIALVLRGIFIILGAALIENFSWVFYLFGLFLIYTAANQAFTGHDDEEETENKLIGFMRKRIAITERFDGAKLRTLVDGRRVFTPVIIVLLALGTTDLVFALDSIPAIFGITQEPFLVFTANVFALMGLRQLYFLLGDLVDKLVYLKYGIAFILAFIGVKLFFHALHENELPFINGGEHVDWAPEISTFVSLAVIVGAMAVAVIASLVKIRYDRKRGIGIDHDRIDEEMGAE
ncbi:TerC family protein [Pseudolysinimonas yzui]|uniref:Tellurium resistance protein TerC n=1 Tax=Pseudolysinimonas yzui TaxID=2708254 RepID=A0A8J3M1Z9_9MICO|nr:TerC family protein [Pseudolysinimonas yzui]GHF05614.1 tellurium resistance protein TerC [Pseudolysinimonas yzui]